MSSYIVSNRISEVVVIDAKTMSPEPVAVVQLPTRVPFGFHAMHMTEVIERMILILVKFAY